MTRMTKQIMRSEKQMFEHVLVQKQWSIIRKNFEGLVLDIGSFDGLLASVYANAIGLEIQQVRSYIPLIVGDMHHLPFRENVIGTVSMCQVLEHTNNPDTVLKEVYRILKNGGKLAISVPNAGAYLAKLVKLIIGYDQYAYPKKSISQYWDHQSFFGYNNLMKILKKMGSTSRRFLEAHHTFREELAEYSIGGF